MYKIGEIAKLMGMTTEAIRYYERKGLITPMKEENSNYRYYNAVQINHLLNIQKYLRFGFSLDFVRDQIHCGTLSDMKEALVNKQNDLHRQQIQLALRQKELLHCLNCITMTEGALETCMLGFRPAMYYLPYMKNRELRKDEQLHKQLSEWLTYADLEFMSLRVEMDKLREDNFELGLAMPRDVGEFLDIHENELVHFYKAHPAVIFSYEATPQRTIEDALPKVHEFAQEHNLTLTDTILSRVLYSRWIDHDDYVVRHLVWIPYEL